MLITIKLFIFVKLRKAIFPPPFIILLLGWDYLRIVLFHLKQKKMKINHKTVVYKGIKFDSEGELARYLYLLDMQKKGKITNLILKPKYNLLPNMYINVEKQLKTKIRVDKKLICRKVEFTPDFAYTQNGIVYHEDYKGCKKVITEGYKLKKKMLYFFHKIQLKEVFSATAKLQGDK